MARWAVRKSEQLWPVRGDRALRFFEQVRCVFAWYVFAAWAGNLFTPNVRPLFPKKSHFFGLTIDFAWYMESALYTFFLTE